MYKRWIVIFAAPVVISWILILVIEVGSRVLSGQPFQPMSYSESSLLPFGDGGEQPSATPTAQLTPIPTEAVQQEDPRQPERTVPSFTPQPRDDILGTQDQRAFIGQTILLSDIVVRRIDSDYAFWVGSHDTRTVVLVYVGTPIVRKRLSVGDQVRVKGTVQTVNQQVVQQFHLNEQQRQRALQEEIYLSAIGIGKIIPGK